MTDRGDERERARAAILKRRAQLVAYAVAAGVAMPACSGRSTSNGKYCLSFAPDGGTTSAGGNGASAGSGYCLGAPLGGNAYGGYGGYGGGNVCLGMPYAGDTFGGSAPIGGAPEGGDGGVSGQGGDPPIFCLSAPLAGAPPVEGGGGDGGANGGGPG